MPSAPLFRRPAIQAVAKVGGAVVTIWLATPPVLSWYLSRRSGLRVRVSNVWISGRNPVLRGVRVRNKDGSELVRARRVVLGGDRVVATVSDPVITVLFGDSQLQTSSWDLDLDRTAEWAPRIALQGEVALALQIRGEETPLRTARFDSGNLEALRGFVGANTLVRRLTQDALRSDMATLPRELRRAAYRIVRERVAEDVEKVRRSTAGTVDDIRSAARTFDRALEGLPDLENYREYARQTDSFLGRISEWLGGVRNQAESGTEAQLQERQSGYRVLDEGPA